MERNGYRKFVRAAGVGAIVVASLAGCRVGERSFDVDKFADYMSKDGDISKDEAKCLGEYIDENGSDEAKSELARAVEQGDDAPAPDDQEVEDEVTELIFAGALECATS